MTTDFRLNLPKEISLSNELKDIIELTIKRSLMMGRMFTPASFVMENGKKKLYVFDMGRTDRGIEEGRKFLTEHSNDITCYTLAYDGFAHIDNNKRDAIVIEAGEKGKEKAGIFILPYEDNNFLFLKRIKPAGNVMYQEATTNYLK